jgi:hypothetical protein
VNISNEVKKIQADIAGINQRLSAVRAAAGGGGGGPHVLLSATHTDTTPAAVQRGDLITGQGVAAVWARLAKGGVTTFLKSDGTDLAWAALAQANVSGLTIGDSPTFAGLTLSGKTQGSVLFAGAAALVSQDNANFFWDDGNNRLGICNAAPGKPLDVTGDIRSSGQLISTVGGMPLAVTGSTMCTNLNADMVDGAHLVDITAGTVFAMPSFLTKKVFWAIPESSSIRYVNCAGSASGYATNDNDDMTAWSKGTTTAVSGNSQYVLTSGVQLVRQGHDPVWIAVVRTAASVAHMRIWSGLIDSWVSSATWNADDPFSRKFIAFRYSADTSANWYYCTKDGANLNAQDSGVACNASTVYVLKFVVDDAAVTVTFTINGGASQVLNANLPGTSIDLGGMFIYLVTTEVVAKTVSWAGSYCEFNQGS